MTMRPMFHIIGIGIVTCAAAMARAQSPSAGHLKGSNTWANMYEEPRCVGASSRSTSNSAARRGAAARIESAHSPRSPKQPRVPHVSPHQTTDPAEPEILDFCSCSYFAPLCTAQSARIQFYLPLRKLALIVL